jgi:hypothetical protein
MKFIKKFISFVFAMLIFASQSGMAFNIHYCEGVLASITIGDETESCDTFAKQTEKSCCTKKSHNECCKDSNIDLKKIAPEKAISKILDIELSAFIFNEFSYSFSFFLLNNQFKSISFIWANFASNAPPLYKLYCQFIHYA